MTTTPIERRYVPSEFSHKVEKRDGGDRLVIEGYAYRFHTHSQNLGGFVEQILPGAGEEAAQNDDIRALFNHDANLILGRNASGTMRLAEDSEGLPYEVDADMRQSYVQDLAISLERGDITHSSFGFRALEDTWSLTPEEFPLRSVEKLALFDVSPVTFPAYQSSSSGLGKRAIEAFCEKRGITPDEMVSNLRADPLPGYDFINEDVLYAERYILLNKNGVIR